MLTSTSDEPHPPRGRSLPAAGRRPSAVAQATHPPRTTEEAGPQVPNPGLFPSVLEGNQVTHILLTETQSPLTGEVGFFHSQASEVLAYEQSPSNQPV